MLFQYPGVFVLPAVDVSYDGEKLVFKGNSFMPKQVRIMSGYILGGEKKIYPAKYLELNKVVLSILIPENDVHFIHKSRFRNNRFICR